MKLLSDADVRSQLELMSWQQQLTFGAACTERLYPLYQLFSDRTGTGSPTLFSRCLDRLWACCSKSAMGSAMSENDATSLCDYDGGDVTECWGQFAAQALADCLNVGNKIPIQNLQSYCLDSVATVLDESGFVVETEFGSKSPYCGYYDQSEFLREYAVEWELLGLLKRQPLDEVGVAHIRRFSREYPVLGCPGAMSFLVRHDNGGNIAKEVHAIIEFLVSIAKEMQWSADVRKQVVRKLTQVGVDRQASAIIWGNAKDAPESIRCLLIELCLGINPMPMLEYLMHVLASRQAQADWHRFTLAMILKFCPGSWRLPMELSSSDPWIGMVLCALEALSSLADPGARWLVHRYVEFPIAAISQRARSLDGLIVLR